MPRCLPFFLLLAGCALGQDAVKPPSFEVADIKPSDPGTMMDGKGRQGPGGRIDARGITAKQMISAAYGVQDNRIMGVPKWADNVRYDLVARAPDGTPPAMLRQMLQPLLADRLKLAIHREDKVMPAYVLTLGKRPLKLEQTQGGPQDCHWESVEGRLRRRICHNVPMDEFARQLPGLGGAGIDLQVIDQTGLKGFYNFRFDMGLPGGGDRKREEGGPPLAVDAGPTIFDALEQIGLKLESRKMPISVIVIDHIEPPSAN
jgi:uncharacterized protein (TIGR03435 family)